MKKLFAALAVVMLAFCATSWAGIRELTPEETATVNLYNVLDNANVTLEEIVRLVLAGAKINKPLTLNKITPLMKAARRCYSSEVVKYLIDEAQRQYNDNKGWLDTIGGAVWLVDNNALNIRDENGMTALMYAAKDNYNAEITRAFISAGAGIKFEDNEGFSALGLAGCYSKNPEIIRILAGKGADVNAKIWSGISRRSLLMYAVEKNKSHEVIRELVRAGADVNYWWLDESPLSIAAEHSTPDVVEVLLEAGAKLSENGGGSEMAWAAKNESYPEILTLLIRHGAKADARYPVGKSTPLMHAASNPNPEAVNILLRHKADVFAKDSDGATPLMYSVYNKNPQVIKILIKAGSDIEARTSSGYTALMAAANIDPPNIEAVKVLLNAGADVMAKDSKGNTALDHARNDSVKELLREAMRRRTSKWWPFF
ncbi:MAG: ankyrin repeat domain-containing protein [Synergistaceae bacterium]|nr:ankyrin repeat domain-containing protein [Synergistaceae bacterium]